MSRLYIDRIGSTGTEADDKLVVSDWSVPQTPSAITQRYWEIPDYSQKLFNTDSLAVIF